MQTTPARFWLNTIVKYADDYDKTAVIKKLLILELDFKIT